MPTVPGPNELDRVFTKENTPLMIPKPKPETKKGRQTLLRHTFHVMVSLQIKFPRTKEYYFVKGERVNMLLEKRWKAGSEKSSACLPMTQVRRREEDRK